MLAALASINRQRAMVLGLDTMRSLLSSLPPALYATSTFPPSVHVTGTNGKGSVVVKLAAALSAQGLRVGAYTSPHLSTFRERIAVDGRLISEDDVVRLVPALLSAAGSARLQPTLFELCTALALAHFHQAAVDVAVVEVGLGGRLDATNVLQPRLAVLTSIGLEHADVLGPTTDDICREKCGIIKAHTPVVVGATVPLSVVRPIAAPLRAEVLVVDGGPWRTFDEENRAIARRCLAQLRKDDAIQAAMRARRLHWDEAVAERALSSRPSCRYQALTIPRLPAAGERSFSLSSISSVDVLLDVGHNPAAISRLMAQLRSDYPERPVRAVFGVSHGKDVDGCLALLMAHCSHVHLVQARSPRAAPIAELQDAARRVRLSSASARQADVVVHEGGDVERTVAHALRLCEADELLLICGSFFIFREARAGLGLHFPTDPVDLNEAALRPPNSDGPERSPPAAAPLLGHSPAATLSTGPHRTRVLRLYREMLQLAEYVRTPLTVTPRQDVQRAFRECASLRASEPRAAAALAEAESKAAFMRAQVPARHRRRRLDEARQPDESRAYAAANAGASRSASARAFEPSTASVGSPATHRNPEVAADAAWTAGYGRIFGDGRAHDASEVNSETMDDDGVRRFVYDGFGEAVVPLTEAERARQAVQRGLLQRVSNSQGITDEQRRRNQQLMERFHFRGPHWQGKKGP